MIDTTHLIAFREDFHSSDSFANTEDDFETLCRKRCRVEYQPNKVPDPLINKYQLPPELSKIKHSVYIRTQFNSLFFI